jgi:hypothetical protein
MDQTCKPPGRAAPGVGRSLLICDGNDHPTKPSALENQALKGKVCPIALATQCRLTSDLLAEAIEIAASYAINILSAIRLADDEAILAEFRQFDAAVRTARCCAKELQNLQAGRLQ